MKGYAGGGGDTTLGLYKLQVVAVEEGLFCPRITPRGSNLGNRILTTPAQLIQPLPLPST